ncbi:MAG TPA: hypothetical protein PK142_01795 [bacterium]|nr:hypothetical protein [bacterium]
MKRFRKFFDREFWSIFVGLIIGEIIVLGIITIFSGGFPKINEINLFVVTNSFWRLPESVFLGLPAWFSILDIFGWFLLLLSLKKMNNRIEDEYPENVQRKIKYLFISFLFFGALLSLVFGVFLGIIISLVMAFITGAIVSIFWEKNQWQIELLTDALPPIFYSATAMLIGLGLVYGSIASFSLFLALAIFSVIIIAISIPVALGILFVIWLFSAEEI